MAWRSDAITNEAAAELPPNYTLIWDGWLLVIYGDVIQWVSMTRSTKKAKRPLVDSVLKVK